MELKKFSLYLFFTLYLILPEYFAIEISSSLPLLTASRCILLLLIANLVLKKKISLYFDRSFIVYFVILLIVDIYHLTTNSSEAIKAIFSLVFEQAILYIVLRNLITSKRILMRGLDLMIKASGVICVLAIVEAFTGTNVFYYLTTTSREMLQASYGRLGFLRAEASFGHPVYFAVYLVCILPFTIYFYENTNKRIYAAIVILNIFAVFCSGTRGGIAVLIVLLFYALFFKRGIIKTKYIKQFVKLFPLLIVIFIIFPQLLDYSTRLITSLLTSLGLLSTDVSNFGGNSSGITSRLAQFTGLVWAKEHNVLLMGFGPGAHKHGLISYVNTISGAWNTTYSIDIGYIGYILLYGITGAFGYAVLYISMARKAWSKSNEKHGWKLLDAFKYFYIAYFVSLTSSVGHTSTFFVFTILMLIYIELERKENLNEK